MSSKPKGHADHAGASIRFRGRDAVLRFTSEENLVETYSNLLETADRKDVAELEQNAARAEAAKLWIRLAKAFERRLVNGDVVASGYPEPINLQVGRIEIPAEDWEFLQLDHWCNAAIERERAYTWRESTTLDVAVDFYKDMEPGWSMEVVRSDPPPPRAVVSWLLFSGFAAGKRAAARVKATIKLERDLTEFIQTERAKDGPIPLKAEMKKQAERHLKRKLPAATFTRIWAMEADPDWRKAGRRPQGSS